MYVINVQAILDLAYVLENDLGEMIFAIGKCIECKSLLASNHLSKLPYNFVKTFF